MDNHLPPNGKFSSSEELLGFLKEHCDDIDGVVIPVQEGVEFVGPQGQRLRQRGVGAVLKLCNGGTLQIHRKDAEMLINDGVLQRLHIKCTLDTLAQSSG